MGNHFAKINVSDKNKTLKDVVYPEINFIEDPVDMEVLQDDDHPEDFDSKNR